MALLTLAVFAAAASGQQPVTFQYFYDDTNQLIKVVDSTGVVIEYVYDSVGNILAINRSMVVGGALAVFNFLPQSGGAGASLTIQGQGFSAVPASNAVTIDGIPATVLSASATALTVVVPAGAMTGSVAVTVGGSTAASTIPYTVVPTPSISAIKPAYAVAGEPFVTVAVTGANFVGATFSFTPGPISVAAASIDQSGTSATLTIAPGSSLPGTYVLIATTGGSSSSIPVPGNSFFVLDPNADDDHDGLTNAQEVALGTDPLNPDTDGDIYPDGVEVAAGSNPLDPASTPLSANPVKEVLSAAFVLVNTSDPSQGPSPDPSVAVHEALGVPLAILNISDPSQGPAPDPSVAFHETMSPSLSVENSAGASLRTADQQRSGLDATTSAQPSAALQTPAVEIETPTDGDVALEGETISVRVKPSDGVTTILVNGTPFHDGREMLFTVPYGTRRIDLSAITTDTTGKPTSSRPVSLSVSEERVVSVSGRVVDDQGNPISGAAVSLNSDGLVAEFFAFDRPLTSLPDFASLRPTKSRLVSAVNTRNPGRMFGGDPFGAGTTNDYAARFRGRFLVTDSGQYTFTLGTREGARLVLDGRVLIDMSKSTAIFEERSATIWLKAGLVPIEILHFENLGDAELQLSYESSGRVRTVVPPELLRSEISSTTNENGDFMISNLPSWLTHGSLRVGGLVLPLPAELGTSIDVGTITAKR